MQVEWTPIAEPRIRKQKRFTKTCRYLFRALFGLSSTSAKPRDHETESHGKSETHSSWPVIIFTAGPAKVCLQSKPTQYESIRMEPTIVVATPQ